MTSTQLSELGIALDKWDTLQDVCFQLLFTNETHMYVSQLTKQYYFDSSDKLIFVRYLTGNPVKAEDRKSGIEYSQVNVKTTSGSIVERYVPIELGGVNDEDIGRYHLVLNMDSLVAII